MTSRSQVFSAAWNGGRETHARGAIAARLATLAAFAGSVLGLAATAPAADLPKALPPANGAEPINKLVGGQSGVHAAPPAMVAPPSPPPAADPEHVAAVAEIEQLIAQLADPDLAKREHATHALRQHPLISLKMVEAVLDRAGVTPEQRARLEAVGFARFAVEPRAAIGVQFVPVGEVEAPPMIGQVFGEFPASRVLQPGDILVKVEGQPVVFGPTAPFSGRPTVVARSPGDVLRMTVRRGNQDVDIDVELGSYAALRNTVPLTAPELTDAWRIRREKRSGMKVLGGPAAVVEARSTGPQRSRQFGPAGDDEQSSDRPMGGGQSRPPVDPEGNGWAAALAMNEQLWGGALAGALAGPAGQGGLRLVNPVGNLPAGQFQGEIRIVQPGRDGRPVVIERRFGGGANPAGAPAGGVAAEIAQAQRLMLEKQREMSELLSQQVNIEMMREQVARQADDPSLTAAMRTRARGQVARLDALLASNRARLAAVQKELADAIMPGPPAPAPPAPAPPAPADPKP